MNVHVESARFREQLRDLGAALENNVRQAVRIATDAAYQDAKGTTLFNDQSGALRDSIQQTVDGMTGKVSRGRKQYMTFVANGTQPHLIAGNPTLSFVWKGVPVNFRYVNHPGTAPRPFMQHAWDVGERTLRPVVDRFVNAAIQRFNAQ